MITVYLYKTFRKTKNSTKRPPGISDGMVIMPGEIKEDFSPMALEITFDLPNDNEMPEFTYAKIETFNRYYFIDSWVFTGGLWTANLTVDVLATYREEIKEQTQYILRSQSDANYDIIDTTYLQQGPMNTQIQSISSGSFWGWDGSVGSGSVVCGIVGNSGYNVGAVTYYAMTYQAFNALMSQMLSGISWMSISTSEISAELQKALINPTQYIVSAIWLPFSLNIINGTSTNYLSLGWWGFNITGGGVKIINNVTNTIYFSGLMSIDKNGTIEGSYAGTDKFLRLSPYSRYTLQFFPFGVFELDTAYLYDADRLMVTVNASPITGDAVLNVYGLKIRQDGGYDRFSAPILTTEANISVPIPTGQVAANIGNFSQALVAGGVAGLNDIVNGVTR